MHASEIDTSIRMDLFRMFAKFGKVSNNTISMEFYTLINHTDFVIKTVWLLMLKLFKNTLPRIIVAS